MSVKEGSYTEDGDLDLICDGCGKVQDGWVAAAAGWSIGWTDEDDGRDYCYSCRQSGGRS